jgi:hypothetical protein
MNEQYECERCGVELEPSEIWTTVDGHTFCVECFEALLQEAALLTEEPA